MKIITNLKLNLANEQPTYIYDTEFDNMTGPTTPIYYKDFDTTSRTTSTINIGTMSFVNSKVHSVISVPGYATSEADETRFGDELLMIDNSIFTNIEGAYNHTMSSDVRSTDSSILRVRNGLSTYQQEVYLRNTKLSSNKNLNSIIGVYGHTLMLDTCEVKDNTVEIGEYIIAQYKADNIVGLNYRIKNSTITNNILTELSSANAGYIIYQDYVDRRVSDNSSTIAISMNLIASTSITNNRANAAIYNSDIRGGGSASMNYSFGGYVDITKNVRPITGNPEYNLLVKDSAAFVAQTINFVGNNTTPGLPVDLNDLISSKSTIGVRIDGTFSTNDVKFIANETWIDEIKSEGVTYQIFKSDVNLIK